MGTTGIDAQKKNFTNDDGFGLRLMKIAALNSQPVSTTNMQEMFQKQAAFVDSNGNNTTSAINADPNRPVTIDAGQAINNQYAQQATYLLMTL